METRQHLIAGKWSRSKRISTGLAVCLAGLLPFKDIQERGCVDFKRQYAGTQTCFCHQACRRQVARMSKNAPDQGYGLKKRKEKKKKEQMQRNWWYGCFQHFYAKVYASKSIYINYISTYCAEFYTLPLDHNY